MPRTNFAVTEKLVMPWRLSIAFVAIASCSPASPPRGQPSAPATHQEVAVGPIQARLRNVGCFSRAYDEVHLASHPEQTVSRFHFRQDFGSQRVLTEAEFDLDFGFELVDFSGRHGGLAFCRESSQGATCGVESDGGNFWIERQGPNLRVELERLEIEGETGFLPDLALRDNRVMILYPSDASSCSDE